MAYIVVALGAGYALNASGESQYGRTRGVIAADQKSSFLAYVKRRHMRSSTSLERLSVGDVVPDSGVTYYDIPFGYGAASYRCSIIGGDILIVDPNTRRVVEVVK